MNENVRTVRMTTEKRSLLRWVAATSVSAGTRGPGTRTHAGLVARAWARASFFGACLFGLAGACGGKTTATPVLGSESHFLMHCTDACDDGLSCIGGICTRSCVTGQDSCSELAEAATCTNQSVEPGNIAVCDVSCSGRADCTPLGDGHLCDGGFCRLAALDDAAPQPIAACDDFRDQTPRPDNRGITIVNTGLDTLYIVPHSPICGLEPSLLRVVRLTPEGVASSELNLQGGVCTPRCGDVMDTSWDQQGEGAISFDCGPGVDCIGPGPAIAIEPGANVFEPARTEFVWARLPRGCARGITTDAVNCAQRVLPPAFAAGSGSYRLFLDARLTPECGPGCDPLRFSIDVVDYFVNDLVLEISSAGGR
jgi:hypothetical protein